MTGPDPVVVPVSISEWQFACCGEPFAVGDEVAWTLLLVTAPVVPRPEEMFIEAAVAPSAITLEASPRTAVGSVVCVAGSAVAWLPEGLPDAGPVWMRGALFEEHHADVPADMPTTRGIVRRIRVVCEEYGSNGRLVAGTARFRDVTSSPETFDLGPVPRGPVHREETGMLVDLEPREVCYSQAMPSPSASKR